jgi:hypothetical protein
MYARYGIPISYFSLGYHTDYHQVTDEPQYIDYEHMARVAQFVHDVAQAIADRATASSWTSRSPTRAAAADSRLAPARWNESCHVRLDPDRSSIRGLQLRAGSAAPDPQGATARRRSSRR